MTRKTAAVPAGPAPLRADARRNRERVIEVAKEVFAEEGLAVPIDVIAKRAEVGVGTIYRHFPTKEMLFAAVVQDRVGRLAEHARSLHDDADPGAAFFRLLDRMVEDGAHKKDLVDALTSAGLDVRAAIGAPGTAMRRAFASLLRRAQETGAVRGDVQPEEIFALLSACFEAASRTRAAPARMFAVVRDGLRAPAKGRAHPARPTSRTRVP